MKYKLVPQTWIDPLIGGQDRDRWQVLVNETLGSIKWGNFLTSWEPVSFSRRTLLHAASQYAI